MSTNPISFSPSNFSTIPCVLCASSSSGSVRTGGSTESTHNQFDLQRAVEANQFQYRQTETQPNFFDRALNIVGSLFNPQGSPSQGFILV